METLYKRTKGNKIQQWQIAVENNADGTGTLVVTYGQVDGKQQVDRETITEGKNVGKKNETSPQEQALSEAESKWAKKRERDRYGLTVEESDEKQLRAPMLAHVYEKHAKKIDWSTPIYCQPKFDGHRCIAIRDEAGDIRLWSRKNVEITSCDHLVAELKLVMPKGSMFDGELYIHGVPLNKIASFIKRKQERTLEIKYYLYDVVSINKFPMRLEKLIEYLNSGNVKNLILTPTEPVTSEEAAIEYQAKCISDGYEGAILRHGDYPYESGARSHGLLKMKTFQDDEFEIIGIKSGKTVQVKIVGGYIEVDPTDEWMDCTPAIFVCVTKEGHEFDVMAQGSYPNKHKLREEWPLHKGKMLTVKYQEYSQTDKPVPIFPVGLQFREDV